MSPSHRRRRPYSIKPPLPSNHGAATTAVDHATAANLPRQRHIARPHLRSTAVARSAWLSAPPSIFGVVPPQALPVGAGGEFRQSSVTGAAGQNLATSTHSYPRIFFLPAEPQSRRLPKAPLQPPSSVGEGLKSSPPSVPRRAKYAAPRRRSPYRLPLHASTPPRAIHPGYSNLHASCVILYLLPNNWTWLSSFKNRVQVQIFCHVLGDVDGVVHMRV
jgi:hypothetical protein